MVPLRDLFTIFLQIGAFTLGGGYAMLAMVERSIVAKKGYIGKEEFWDMIAVVQTLPGVFAINTALYVGYKLRGKRGALCASVGAALPSFIAILLIAMFFADWKLALLSLAALPIGMLAMGMMFKLGMSRMEAYYAAAAKMNNTIIEYCNGMEVVKVFNRDGESYERFEHDINYYRDMTLDWYKVC